MELKRKGNARSLDYGSLVQEAKASVFPGPQVAMECATRGHDPGGSHLALMMLSSYTPNPHSKP